MALNAKVQIEGLREFQKLLRLLPDDIKDNIRDTNVELAEVIARDARQRANSRPVKRRTGMVAQSIRTAKTLRAPTIRVRGHKRRGRSSDAFVQEFGGRAPLFGNRNIWNTVRAKNKRGWFLYPSIRAKRDFISARYLAALDEALRGVSLSDIDANRR